MYKAALLMAVAVSSLLLLIGCQPHSQNNSNHIVQEIKENSPDPINEAALLNQVRIFTIYEDETGQEAWNKLQAYPRQELLNALLSAQHSTTDDLLKGSIAFTLCNLDYDYSANREVIVSMFNKSIRGAGEFQRPIHRLIERGDKGLLQVLFAILERSDGDLAEGLAETFVVEMQNNPEEFLKELKSQPKEIRREVYEQIHNGMWEGERIRQYLETIPKGSPVAQVAKEMLKEFSKMEDEG